jgi:NodT family efflux transporter outer membrane factor (OMF) lipoprotein
MRNARTIFAAILTLTLGACRVGPNYSRPSAPLSAKFKEPPPAGWKEAEPGGAFLPAKWWEIYKDPVLNALEEQVSISNQNVLLAEAQYREAKAAAREARSALFPTVGANVSITETHAGGVGVTNASSGTNSPANSGNRTFYSLPFNVAWEPDLWGSIRRNITGNIAIAQATAADLDAARLLFQAELAQDYFQIHGLDGEAELLERTAASYVEYLTLTRNRFASGVASDLDVAQAESQLYSAQASLIELGVQRAQLEHAIAILIGKPPADLSVQRAALNLLPPPVPIALPSDLLERRPDIAGSERGRGVPKLDHRQLVQLAQPVLVGGSAAFGNAVRRGPAPRGGGSTTGGLRRDRGRLSPECPDRVATGGRQPGRAAYSGHGER